MSEDLSLFLKALKFSAEKHRHQRRKDEPPSPYINHPIEVADILWSVGQVHDVSTIVAALLHDTIEDTDTTPAELNTHFGPEVLGLVLEVSDDKSLPKQERKLRQIQHAPHLSRRAKLLKMADKICNINNVANLPPKDWPWPRRMDYLQWADDVFAGLRGINLDLEKHFDQSLAAAREKLRRESKPDQ